jgi:hypothetical protein
MASGFGLPIGVILSPRQRGSTVRVADYGEAMGCFAAMLTRTAA